MSEYNGSLKSYIDSIPEGELGSDLGDLMQNRLASMGNAMWALANVIKCEEFENEEEREFRDELIKDHNNAYIDMCELITILRAHIATNRINPKGTE